MANATKKRKEKKKLYTWKAGANSGHTTNLKQSILETFNIYAISPVLLNAYKAMQSF
jgi:hypothetical protein